MTSGDVKPRVLSAAGYGEFAPVAPKGTAQGRRKDRRIEITETPDGRAIVGVPGRECTAVEAR